MSETDRLLAEIRSYCTEHKIAPSTFGRKAANAGHLVKRLESGKPITTATMERVRAFIAQQRAAA